jgi:glycolate oxidase FAD binding subunit
VRDDQDSAELLHEAIARAHAANEPVCIVGSGSKACISAGADSGPHAFTGRLLTTVEHRGVIDYRPDELVVTARAGTPLAQIEQVLAAHDQHLPFDPPRFNGGGTLGGAIAAGLSGPARPWRGAIRDAVLGVELVNGLGERLRFGGQVMKNVAGYDLSRLQAGAFGTLGLLLSVSVKVLPRPAAERTLAFELEPEPALARMREWAREPWPVTGLCYTNGVLRVRLAGALPAVADAARVLGGDMQAGEGRAAEAFWTALRDHRLDSFSPGSVLWRASVPPAARGPLDGCLVNWGGAERWWAEPRADDATQAEFHRSEIAASVGRFVREVLAAGGSARRFDGRFGAPRADGPGELYATRLKEAFDPRHILNPHLAVGAADRAH